MAKTAPSIYVLGLSDGPVKVGMTAVKPLVRLQAARRETGNQDLELKGMWKHPDAFFIEKFVHIYLQEFLIEGEWFAVTPIEASEAVVKTIDLLDQSGARATKNPTWFERAGISPSATEAYLGCRPRSGVEFDRASNEADLARRLSEDLNTRKLLARTGISHNTVVFHNGPWRVAKARWKRRLTAQEKQQ